MKCFQESESTPFNPWVVAVLNYLAVGCVGRHVGFITRHGGFTTRFTTKLVWKPRTALRSGFWCRADMAGYKPNTAADTAALYPDTAADTAALYPDTAAAVAGYKPDIALKCPILICLSARVFVPCRADLLPFNFCCMIPHYGLS